MTSVQHDFTYPMLPKLTPTETNVARLIAYGNLNKEIAHATNIHLGTVKAHIGNLLKKIGGTNRVDVAMYYLATADEADVAVFFSNAIAKADKAQREAN